MVQIQGKAFKILGLDSGAHCINNLEKCCKIHKKTLQSLLESRIRKGT